MSVPFKLWLAQFVAKEFGLGILRGYSIDKFLEQFQPSPRASLRHYLTPQYFALQELIHGLPRAATTWESEELKTELSKLLVESEPQVEELSILDFHGILASDTSDRESFRDLALRLIPDLPRGNSGTVCFVIDKDFIDNQEIFERRNGGSPVKAQRQSWNGRLDMMDTDGSHHLAGVLRQCLDQGRDAVFSCRVRTVSVDAATVDRMLRRWHLLMASDQTVSKLRDSLDAESVQSKQHLRHRGQENSPFAKFGQTLLHRRKEDALTILAVPRSWKHGDKVRATLLTHQEECVFDLSDYLSQLVDAQHRGERDQSQPKGKQFSTGYRHPRGRVRRRHCCRPLP